MRYMYVTLMVLSISSTGYAQAADATSVKLFETNQPNGLCIAVGSISGQAVGVLNAGPNQLMKDALSDMLHQANALQANRAYVIYVDKRAHDIVMKGMAYRCFE